jgi:hypothetical protein
VNPWTRVRLCREWRIYLMPTNGHLALCSECGKCRGDAMQEHAGAVGHETCHPPYCSRRADDTALGALLTAQKRALLGREAALCLATGIRSRTVVLDFDRHGKIDGVSLFRRLDSGREPERPLPPTLMATTPRDGIHLFYRLPEDLKVFHGRNFPKQGWDLKADGGHVKLAPTQKGEQGGYRWDTSEWGARPPESVEALPLAPDWILELGKKRPPAVKPAAVGEIPLDAKLSGIHRVVAGAEQGERDGKTYWAACRLVEMVKQGETTEEVALAALATAVAMIPDQDGLEPDLAVRKWMAAVRTVG